MMGSIKAIRISWRESVDGLGYSKNQFPSVINGVNVQGHNLELSTLSANR
jgi:hypothetical protein